MTTKKAKSSGANGASHRGNSKVSVGFDNKYTRISPSLSSIKKLDRYLSRMQSAKSLAQYLSAFSKFLATIDRGSNG